MRKILLLLVATLTAGIWAVMGHAAQPVIEVYKSPYCGCCEVWVEHLRANGFEVKSNDVKDTSGYRAKLGMPAELGSCHIAKVGDYVIEGHVPAREIKRLLAEKPKARGLAVPGMPLGSPGMEADRNDAYDVLLVGVDGKPSVYQHYPGDRPLEPAPAAALSEGEVRKIDAARGRITLKHGAIANLGMPPMTMVFEVAQADMLQGLKSGDKVRFAADKNGNAYRVTRIEVQR